MSKVMRYTAYAVALALAAGLSTDTAAAMDAETSAAEFLPGLVDSSEIDVAPVLEGRIFDTDGGPAEDAQIQLLAWPPRK